VTAVAGLPDGRVASADTQGTVWTRHPDSPAQTAVEQRAGNTSGVKSVEALVALADGRLVAAGWDQTLRILDPNGAVLRGPTSGTAHRSGHSRCCATVA
jgi:hypothetical protein